MNNFLLLDNCALKQAQKNAFSAALSFFAWVDTDQTTVLILFRHLIAHIKSGTAIRDFAVCQNLSTPPLVEEAEVDDEDNFFDSAAGRRGAGGGKSKRARTNISGVQAGAAPKEVKVSLHFNRAACARLTSLLWVQAALASVGSNLWNRFLGYALLFWRGNLFPFVSLFNLTVSSWEVKNKKLSLLH